MVYLPKKVCLIIIHTNTTRILDMFCCRQHQQQRNDIMQRVTVTFTCHHTRYHELSLSLVCFGAICNALPRVTVKFINMRIYIYIYLLKKGTITLVVTHLVTLSGFGNASR